MVCIALLAAGCSGSSWIPTLKPYRIDIQQGNAVTRQMVAKLKPGMTRAQVRFALGTPLVVDPFHSDRWDYVYYYDKAGEPREYRYIVVVFKNDRLDRIEGDVVSPDADGKGALSIDKAAAAAEASKIDSAATAKSAPGAATDAGQSGASDKPADPPKEKEERGFFGRAIDWLGF